MKSLHAIAERLKEAMGLDMATVGSSLIERVVRERMALLDIGSDQAYLAVLLSNAQELQHLIELAVVPETWFFRDAEAMLAVARLGREKLVTQPGSRLRILSLPCSTGEEPYSLAMALFDAGVPAAAFHIDAVDIRTRSLEIAANGVYGRNSFRGRELGFRDRYFQHEQGQWRIASEVMQQVRFQAGNILAPDFMRTEAPYDFILCRNVLIYFERDVQMQVVGMLERLLADDGHIFVGPAEGGLMLSERVVSAGIALAFGFRKRVAVTAPPAASPRLPITLTPLGAAPLPAAQVIARPMPVAPLMPVMPEVSVMPVAPVSSTATATPDWLAQARRLADQGDFVQAQALCERAVREHGPSADAFYLQGLIGDAGGDQAGAQRSYRKAIYLDPAHHEALQHLAALLQAQGDQAGAQLMRQRATRAEQVAQAAMKQGEQRHG